MHSWSNLAKVNMSFDSTTVEKPAEVKKQTAESEDCKSSEPVAIVDMHGCSDGSEVKICLDSTTGEKPTEVKKQPTERKKASSFEAGSESNLKKRKLSEVKDPYFLCMEEFEEGCNPDLKGVKEKTKPYLDEAATLFAYLPSPKFWMLVLFITVLSTLGRQVCSPIAKRLALTHSIPAHPHPPSAVTPPSPEASPPPTEASSTGFHPEASSTGSQPEASFSTTSDTFYQHKAEDVILVHLTLFGYSLLHLTFSNVVFGLLLHVVVAYIMTKANARHDELVLPQRELSAVKRDIEQRQSFIGVWQSFIGVWQRQENSKGDQGSSMLCDDDM